MMFYFKGTLADGAMPTLGDEEGFFVEAGFACSKPSDFSMKLSGNLALSAASSSDFWRSSDWSC